MPPRLVLAGSGQMCAHEIPLRRRARAVPARRLLRQAVAAERAGFDGISCSDHLQPWWEGGEAGHAWVWLGAVGQATEKVPIGTAVTPPGPRYHPVLIAQAWATLETMFPGRPYLGFGSGESLNETPLGAEWPTVRRAGRADGGGAGDHQRACSTASGSTTRASTSGPKGAFLHTRPERRPPIYVSAFGPKAAGGRRPPGRRPLDARRPGDGAGGDRRLPRRAAEDAGREPGEIVLQAQFSWAGTTRRRSRARASGRARSRTSSTPTTGTTRRRCTSTARGSSPTTSSSEALIISADPDVHVERIREIEEIGATRWR